MSPDAAFHLGQPLLVLGFPRAQRRPRDPAPAVIQVAVGGGEPDAPRR